MQTQFSLYFLAIVMGFFLTGCSSNNVKPENNKTTSSSVGVKKQAVNHSHPKANKRIVSKAQPTKKSVVRKKTKPKPIKRTPVKRSVSNYKRRNLASNQYRKKRNYTARKNIARKKYTPRKKYTARKYTARKQPSYKSRRRAVRRVTPHYPPAQKRNYGNASFAKALSNAAVRRTHSRVRYDGKYVKIGYPWGDVPGNIGVCTDVVIRSYRRLGVDLQKAVHEDMANGGFYDYPNVKKWGLSAPDKNIDHRRVYNLQAFFRRHGAQLPITRNPTHYKPGDLVTWMVGPGLPHIGVVVEQRSKVDPRRHMIVHNIANGPEMEDILFRFRITGHYRYTKNNRLVAPRRHNTNYVKNKGIGSADYQRLMRELSVAPRPRKRTKSRRINVARSGISDADIRAVLGK